MPEEKVVMYESPEAASIQTVTDCVGAGESGETPAGGKPSPRSPRLLHPSGFMTSNTHLAVGYAQQASPRKTARHF